MLKITSRDPDLPPMNYIRDSGGIYVDMMIHDFDMARALSLGSSDRSLCRRSRPLSSGN